MKVADILQEIKEIQEKTKENIEVINHSSSVTSTAIKGIEASLKAGVSNTKFMLENNARLIKNISFKDKIIFAVIFIMAFLVGLRLQDITGLLGV